MLSLCLPGYFSTCRCSVLCVWLAALPYNAIEVLILGNITNKGSTPLNLKGSWIIVPFSMGVQTQFEGIWKREPDPNNYFTIYCW